MRKAANNIGDDGIKAITNSLFNKNIIESLLLSIFYDF